MAQVVTSLVEVLEQAVQSAGYEFVGHEIVGQAAGRTLRVYVDAPTGVGLDDCQQVSRQLSLSLEAKEPSPIAEPYRLEVSSPGIERPLFTLEHYRGAVGRQIQLKQCPQSEARARRRYVGRLVAVEDQDIVLELEQGSVRLPFAQIESGKLKVDWSKKGP